MKDRLQQPTYILSRKMLCKARSSLLSIGEHKRVRMNRKWKELNVELHLRAMRSLQSIYPLGIINLTNRRVK
jgi:hypothetical protein